MCCGSNSDLVALGLHTRCRPGDGGDSACLRNEALDAIGERPEFTSVLIVQQLPRSPGLVKSLLDNAIDRLSPMGPAAPRERPGPDPIIDAREETSL